MTSDPYRRFLSIFYPIFFVLAVALQAFLIYVIFAHSPKYLKTFKKFLVNTCILQTIMVTTCCSTQYRMISTSVPIELRSYGPCRHLEAWVGFSVFQLFQTSATMSGVSILITIYLKFEAARTIEISRTRMLRIVIISHIPASISAVLGIFIIIKFSLPAEVRLKYLLINQNMTDYSIVGALSLNSAPSFINFLIISSFVIVSPVLCFFFRQLRVLNYSGILKRINSQLDKSSQLKKSQNRIFVQGLTIQALLPTIFYIPIFLVYFYCLFTHDEVLFQQYFMVLLPALPALFDPLVTLYFVTPYRRRVKLWMRLEKKSKILSMRTSQANTLF